jgi:hypothetical protein
MKRKIVGICAGVLAIRDVASAPKMANRFQLEADRLAQVLPLREVLVHF